MVESQPAIGRCMPFGETAGVLQREPGLIMRAGGVGYIWGSGMGQDKLDLGVVDVMVVRAELRTGAMWCTVDPVCRKELCKTK